MISRLACIFPLILPLTVVAATSTISDSSPLAMPELASEVVTVAKAPVPFTEETRQFLAKRDGANAKVWVFFTDKGVFTRPQFQSAASSLIIGEAAMKRRAKTGMDKVVFADLPVQQEYVDRIIGFGASLRWKSNWLNAASFVIPVERLDQVGALPFVAKIQPIAVGKRIPEPEGSVPEDTRTESPKAALSPAAFNYGSAALQLGQINVPPAHDQGYHGEGVTLAMFDTGFRTSHSVFAATIAEGRLIAQYDFVFHDSVTSNQPADWSTAWDHGTLTWSTAAGMKDGKLYGPAFKSKILLCKTEDIRSETQVEEDNWLAAVEWVSGLGADVISSSLSYSTFDTGTSYVNSNYDGTYCISTKAANLADSLGILVVNAMGNAGPTSPSLGAPADAFRDLSVGAVNSTGGLANFSSRGPTFDGRIKPEVCARGVSTACATSTSDSSYGGASGTSLSTPLVAGAACLVIQAHPTFPPSLIRQAMMETAGNAATPNNDYGWGIINTDAAIGWGASVSADVRQGNAPLTVQFSGSSGLSPSAWLWDFGDGQTSTFQSPSHVYTLPGIYSVLLTVQTSYGPITSLHANYIAALGDTLRIVGDSAFAGRKVMVSVSLANSQYLASLVLPLRLPNSPYKVSLDSIRKGTRTGYFEAMSTLTWDTLGNRYTVELIANNGGGAPNLAPGTGEVLRIYGRIDSYALGGVSAPVDTTDLFGMKVRLVIDVMTYAPMVFPGQIVTKGILRCDVDYSNDGNRDISDLIRLVTYLYLSGPPPITIQSGDCDADRIIDIADVTRLVDYLYLNGLPPVNP